MKLYDVNAVSRRVTLGQEVDTHVDQERRLLELDGPLHRLTVLFSDAVKAAVLRDVSLRDRLTRLEACVRAWREMLAEDAAR